MILILAGDCAGLFELPRDAPRFNFFNFRYSLSRIRVPVVFSYAMPEVVKYE